MPASHETFEGGESTPPYRNVGTNERRLSLLGGVIAALMAVSRGGVGGLALGALGGFLIYRGGSGHCPISQRLGRNTARPGEAGLLSVASAGAAAGGAALRASVTINREVGDIYTFWHDFSRMPEFMSHIKEVSPRGEDRWHWVAELPVAGRVEWDSEITADVPNERIAWRSLEGSDIRTDGEVRFHRHAEGRGSDVRVEMRYQAGGALGKAASKWGKSVTQQMLKEDLRRFKQIMEAGELARIGATGEALSSPRLQ